MRQNGPEPERDRDVCVRERESERDIIPPRPSSMGSEVSRGTREEVALGTGAIADFKADGSPLTSADTAANTIICDALRKAYPKIPIISEENKMAPLRRSVCSSHY